MEQGAFKITFRPVVDEAVPRDPPGKGRSWLARLFEPDSPRVEPYAVTVSLSPARAQRTDGSLLRAAFRTAAAHGGTVQVRCSDGPQSIC